MAQKFQRSLTAKGGKIDKKFKCRTRTSFSSLGPTKISGSWIQQDVHTTATTSARSATPTAGRSSFLLPSFFLPFSPLPPSRVHVLRYSYSFFPLSCFFSWSTECLYDAFRSESIMNFVKKEPVLNSERRHFVVHFPVKFVVLNVGKWRRVYQ